MTDKRIQYTDKMVGNGHPSLPDTLNALTLVGHNSDGSHKGYVYANQEGNLTATLAAVSSTTLVIVSDTQTLTAGTITNPITVVPGGAINVVAGNTVTLNGVFEAGLYHVFTGNGSIVFGAGAVAEVYPEWWGAIADADTSGNGTDSTAAIQSAFNAAQPTQLTGNYIFSNLTVPSEKVIRGNGIHTTALIAKTGSTGVAFTDQGSAAKITIEDFAIYCRSQAGYTAGLKLGFNTIPFGTEGFINNIWVRDLPTGVIGININGNVGQIGRVIAQNTGGLQIIGTSNMVGQLESMEASGFDVSGTNYACNFQDCQINALEVEATATGVIPVLLSGNTSIDYLTLSIDSGKTFSHLIEVSASASTWGIGNIRFYFDTGAGYTVTNGNIKMGSIYFGGNASAKSYSGEGKYCSGMMTSGTQFGVKTQQLQAFTLRVTNTGGTMQHRITDQYGNGVPTFVTAINGANASLHDTPTGTDSTTAMAYGGKISSAVTNVFIFDTANQIPLDMPITSSITYNSSGASITVLITARSVNINGVTKNRMEAQFYNDTTGAAFALTTSNLASGKIIDIAFFGFLA